MTQVGSVYGEALYDLARSENLDETILKELDVLAKSFDAEPDFIKLLGTPSLSKEERCRILDDSFRGKVQPYVLNFLKILTEKGYIRHFSHCVQAYRESWYRDNDILLVEAVTAVPLTMEQLKKLTRKMISLTGKTIELRNRLDPTVIGGIRLDYDGKRLDDTVSHRLEAVRTMLKNTVL